MDKTVEELQEEMNLLKNEIKETLMDVREYLLTTADNPLEYEAPKPAPQAQQAKSAAGPVEEPQVNLTPLHRRAQAPSNGEESQQASAPPVYQSPPQMGAMGSYAHGPAQMPHMETAAAHPEQTQPAPGQEHHWQPVHYAPSNGQTAANPDMSTDGWHHRPDTHGQPLPPHRSAGSSTSRQQEASQGERSSISQSGSGPSYQSPAEDRSADKISLFSIASLMPFMEQGVRKIGQRRMKGIIDLYASVSGISIEMRDVLVSLVDLDDTEPPKANASMRDAVRVLVELDNLLWQQRQDWQRAALYSMFGGSKPGQMESWLSSMDLDSR